MPNYVVHIGPPKTGTKYLQHSLYKLRETMLRDAINYPNDMWTHKREFSHFRLVEEITSHRCASRLAGQLGIPG